MKVKAILVAGLVPAMLATAAFADTSCRYNGNSYSHGSSVCQSGTQYRCDDGEWNSLGVTCKGDGGAANCDYNGTGFSAGSTSCQSGTQYRCTNGQWTSLSVACGANPPSAGGDLAPNPPRTCMLAGTTVASASTVCKEGTTYLCNDGDWRNLGTPCR